VLFLLWAVSGPHACRGSPPPSSRSYTVTVKRSLAAVAVCAARPPVPVLPPNVV